MKLWPLLLVSAALAADSPETVLLRKYVAATPRLPFRETQVTLEPPVAIDMVSSAAVGPGGETYILQRGDKADPILVVRGRTLLRSWGRGLFKIPHSIRIAPNGNVWTVDSGSSMVYEFSPRGQKLREISIELPAKPRGPFCGASDIAFAPNGHFYISDGYQNARVIEFDEQGKRVREWGTPGKGPGEFNLPHGIAVDPGGIVYVADRENLRIQRFTPQGRYIGEWNLHGKVFCLKWAPDGYLWAGTQPHDVPNGAEGWLMKIDPAGGKVLGLIESFGHSIEVTPAGNVLTGRRPGSTLVFVPARREFPQPPVVSPAAPGGAPSDAVVLFDGRDASRWQTRDGGPARCEIDGGALSCRTGSGDIYSTELFRSAQIHLEFNVPSMPEEKGQRRGNSGVYLHGKYEIQILDSVDNPTYADGMLGALYGQAPPLVNAARRPGEWQSYDITFHAPRCDSKGAVTRKGTVTVLLNGILVQDHVSIDASEGCEPGPLMIQDHSGFPGAPVTVLKLRNIWLRRLD